jgi:hypothetical protein
MDQIQYGQCGVKDFVFACNESRISRGILDEHE